MGVAPSRDALRVVLVLFALSAAISVTFAAYLIYHIMGV